MPKQRLRSAAAWMTHERSIAKLSAWSRTMYNSRKPLKGMPGSRDGVVGRCAAI